MNELRCIKTVKEVRNDDNRGVCVVTVVSGGVCGVREITCNVERGNVWTNRCGLSKKVAIQTIE